ncbi:mitochondrial import inner membrane translocase subunit TIM23-1 [Brassica rapa]|uniref:Mitochondrial import inner membrane translocase subunit TIM23 n=1 Tax=Brassica campestris TaxID=3711 RepID=M4EB07_BRACM|nr:mitochondrial import inner membrane translocase subunit TIM23-1 [Brassica rapa]
MATNHSSDDESTRLYHPYQSYELPIKAQHLYKLPTSPEYLFTEESLKKRRSWGENLTFYAGTAYLGGSVAGAASGVISGVKSFEYGDTAKLKINRVLNSSGHKGRSLGCRIGAVGLIYAGIESGVVAYMDRDDVWTSVVAGLGTGAVFRAARGVRSAAVAGALGGMVAGGVVAGKQVLKRYAHI